MKTSTKLLSYFFTAGVMALSPFSAFAAEGSGTNGFSFYDYLAANADKDTVIDFNQAPATGNVVEHIDALNMDVTMSDIGGLYMLQSTKGDEKPVYFYRGNVENNNVILNDMCWLIVRTTETGGTKLLYNGTPTSGQCLGDQNYDIRSAVEALFDSENNSYPSTLIGKSKFNDNHNSPADFGYMYGQRYEAQPKAESGSLVASYQTIGNNTYVFGNDVTYSDDYYHLQDIVNVTGSDENSVLIGANGHHYTCLSSSTDCSDVYYVVGHNNYQLDQIQYIVLNDGDKIEDAVDKMGENTNNSTIKQYIESWYEDNMSAVASLLEDTIWYSGKAFGSGSLSSKNVDMSNIFDNEGSNTVDTLNIMAHGITREDKATTPLIRTPADNAGQEGELNYLMVGYFGNVNMHPDLSYGETANRFTVDAENGNGKLVYPVGLLDISEVILAGATGHAFAEGATFGMYIDNNYTWWTISPNGFWTTATINTFGLGGIGETEATSTRVGVRPVVSLKYGLGANSGDGSKENPFTNITEESTEDEEPPAEGETTPVNPQTSDAIMKAALLGIIGALPILIARKELKKR